MVDVLSYDSFIAFHLQIYVFFKFVQRFHDSSSNLPTFDAIYTLWNSAVIN